LDDGEVESAHLTCSELKRRAGALAAELRARCSPGSRALLLFPPGLEFIVAFFGCLSAGVVAVPAYPPRPRHDRSRLRAIADDAEPEVVLTTAALSEEIRRSAEEIPGLSGASWVATDQIPDEEIDWEADEPSPEAAASRSLAAAGLAEAPAYCREAVLALPREERLAYVEECLRAKLSAVVGVEPGRINAARPLTELGLDSLGAIGWKQAVDAALGVSPSLVDLLSGLTLAAAARQLCESLAIAGSADRETSDVIGEAHP
jgi:hypothetical protein